MSWQTLRPQIKTLLTNSGLFQEVSGTPKIKFNGYPAVHVVKSDNESDYNTNKENERVYAFLVRIFYESKQVGVATAEERLEETVDAIIDAIDQDAIKPSTTRVIGISLPSGYIFIDTIPVPSVFGEIESEQLVMAEIRVRIKIIRDIT